jgi:hypothetical protein
MDKFLRIDFDRKGIEGIGLEGVKWVYEGLSRGL